MNDPKGSQWRKWDLHFHTPSSYDYGDNSVTNEMIISSLKAEDISVVAITDHHVIDVARIKELQTLAKSEGITVLPGIEFLSDAKGSDPVHFIAIFAEESNLQHIWDQIKNRTAISKIEGEGKKANEIYCDLSETISIAKELGGIVSIHAGAKSNSIECITNALPHTMAQKNDIAHLVDIFEIGKESDQRGYMDDVFPVIKKKIPMVICSDNHDIKKYILKQNCWIKADTTFEGLKQVIYEPDERVRIQEVNPEFEYDKPYFDSLKIDEDVIVYEGENLKLSKGQIKFNKNLVTIIGGRGEGKSTLINYLAYALNKIEQQEFSGKDVFTSDENFCLEYHKINDPSIAEIDKNVFHASERDGNELGFVFIKQGELKDKTKDELSSTLKKLLNLGEANFSKSLSTEISNINLQIDGIEDWKNEKDEFGDLVNSKEFHDLSIKKNTTLLESLKNSKNKENIENFNKNLKVCSGFKKIINDADSILNKVGIFLTDVERIVAQGEPERFFTVPNLKDYIKEVKAVRESYETKIKDKEAENEVIKKELSVNGLSGDLTSLLENTTKYQNLIDEAQRCVVEIESKEATLGEWKIKRAELGGKIKQDYIRQKSEIDTGWSNFLSKHPKDKQKIIKDILLKEDKLVVEGKIFFDKNKFYDSLSSSLNKNTVKSIGALESEYQITDLTSWADFVEKKFNEKFETLSQKKHEFLNLFFSTEKRSEYLKTEAEIKYDGKELSKLSAGQKGTAYLRIQLANSAFSEPIIFDQPEDDLDNKFIVEELIKIFRELKKFRQIIIVTHNANLVINADAEQVIISKNTDENLSYVSGSLENKVIQDHVCDILEGGKEAFEQRKKKYNI